MSWPILFFRSLLITEQPRKLYAVFVSFCCSSLSPNYRNALKMMLLWIIFFKEYRHDSWKAFALLELDISFKIFILLLLSHVSLSFAILSKGLVPWLFYICNFHYDNYSPLRNNYNVLWKDHFSSVEKPQMNCLPCQSLRGSSVR